ncbi:hypothetical protein [Glycomyces salinus]|uniref:hypothetical protein n=1 Tax=Glycomyces salinus TaxID=980294 RepID=UPI0018EDC617|nr:hypothetical protein [Glycomyces salinus]
MAAKITFRPTPRQIAARTLLIASPSCLVALLPAVIHMAVSGRWRPGALGAIVLAAVVIAWTVAVWGSRRVGVVVDERGIRPIAGGGECGWRWTAVADIRAERRGGRTVPVLYPVDPARGPWRLRAPYSGRGLAVDEGLDEKIFVMRSLWGSHRLGPASGRKFRS